jgi:lipoprotein-anchoring transpeptidase ErfK/SrfK
VHSWGNSEHRGLGPRRLRNQRQPICLCRSGLARHRHRYPAREAPGTLVVDADQHHLCLVQSAGKTRRHGVGVGNEGARWAGIAMVHNKQEWPDWYPTAEILQRHPELTPDLKWLPGGLGLPGGEDNPLGARALYLWQQNRDTLYRIHGTNEPWTISIAKGQLR